MPISRIETASLDAGLVAPTATALTTASGSAPSYSARAWVNFNGTGTVAIRASGNVSSITDAGVGTYTVNFATAMPDVNYNLVGACTDSRIVGSDTYAVGSVRVGTYNISAAFQDMPIVCVSIFR